MIGEFRNQIFHKRIIGKFLQAVDPSDDTITYADFDDMGFFGSFMEAIPRKILLDLDNSFSLKGYKDRLYYMDGYRKKSYWFDFEDRVSYFDRIRPERYQIPGSINIESSSKCILNCKMCWAGGSKYQKANTKSPPALMDMDLYGLILEQISEAFPKSRPIACLSFRGEPLLNKRLPEMIAAAGKKGVNVLLITNAMLLTENMAQRLLDAGLWEIAFSVNSHEPETYQKIQKKGDFSRVLRNIENFLKQKEAYGARDLRVCYRAVLQEENENQMEQMIQHFFTPEIFNISFQYEILRPDFPGGGGRAWKTFRRIPQKVPCWNLWWNCTITTEGNVLPCVTCTNEREGELMGNVKETHLSEIWNNDLYQRYRELHLSNRIDEVPFCRHCDQHETSNWSNNPRILNGVEHLTYPAVYTLRRI